MKIQQNPKIISRRIGSQWVILEDNKKYIRELNGTAGFVWALLRKPMTTVEVIGAVVDSFETDKKTATADVEKFVNEYLKNGLITVVER